LKKVRVVSGFIKKSKGFAVILVFFLIFLELFFIGKVMDRVYGSRDHGWFSVHDGLTEREVVGVPTNGTTWRRSCIYGYMTAFNRGGWWCSDGEMVLGARRRY
jgi:hypothetical protein